MLYRNIIRQTHSGEDACSEDKQGLDDYARWQCEERRDGIAGEHGVGPSVINIQQLRRRSLGATGNRMEQFSNSSPKPQCLKQSSVATAW